MEHDPENPRAASDVLYADFRPRMTRIFARVVIAILIAGAVLIVITSPGASGLFAYGIVDVLGIAVILAGAVWLLWRHASVQAWASDEGLRVRNLIYTTELAWPQIESVRFGAGRPWVQLDLTNGHTLAVMAIQSADGAYSTHEARRLATLVAAHGEAIEPPGPVDLPGPTESGPRG